MFKVGDKVRIREDLNIDMDDIVEDMMKYAGRETIITGTSFGSWKLEIDDGLWYWTSNMFEKITPQETKTGVNNMTVLEYFETKQRMTKGVSMYDICGIKCIECGLCNENNGTDINCRGFEMKYPERAIAIVQKWGEEHPVKTLLDKLLEVFPDVPKREDGTPMQFCPSFIGYKAIECGIVTPNCVKCWNQPYEEVDE